MANINATTLSEQTRQRYSSLSPQRVRTLYAMSLLAMDVLGVLLAFVIAYWLRLAIPFPTQLPPDAAPINSYGSLIALFLGSIIFIGFLNKHYYIPRAPSRVTQMYRVFASVSIGTLLAIATATFLFKYEPFVIDFPRAVTIYTWALTIIILVVVRLIHQAMRDWLRAKGIGADRLLVVGTGASAKRTLEHIKNSPHLGYDVVGVVSPDANHRRFAGYSVLGRPTDLPRLIEQYHISDVIIAMPERLHREVKAAVENCQLGRVSIKIFQDVFDFNTEEPSIDDLGKFPLLTVSDFSQAGYLLFVKRLIDVLGAGFGLLMLSPLMLLVAILIKLESRGPAFFVQERMGLDGRQFRMLKFRSMREDAEENGPGWTVEDDPRRTRIGAILRKTNFDELPQLINVLVGEMSLVGPRPEQPYFVEQFRKQVPGYMARHQLRAGMTGWAQVNGLRGDTSIADRTESDLYYNRHWSLGLDIQILIRTIWQTISGRNHGAG